MKYGDIVESKCGCLWRYGADIDGATVALQAFDLGPCMYQHSTMRLRHGEAAKSWVKPADPLRLALFDTFSDRPETPLFDCLDVT